MGTPPGWATLGLKRGTVRLVDYDPLWPMIFAEEKERLGHLLGGGAVQIEHVGSTSVPGLGSKPIIDIALAVEKLEAAIAWEPLLREEGYTYFGDREARGDHFFAKGSEEARTIYLHVVLSESSRWKNYLSFRQQLRESAALRESYGSLKMKLALAHPTDREAYSRDKAAFIEGLLEPPGASIEPGLAPK